MLHLFLVVFLVLGALACLSLAALSWRRRLSTGYKLFAGLLLSVVIYALGYAGEISSARLEQMRLYNHLEYIGIPQIAAFWLALCLYYANHVEWLKPRRLALLWVLPAIMLLAMLTNDWHHLVYTRTWIYETPLFPMLAFERGPLYWVNIGYSFFSFALVAVLLARRYLSSNALYRRQVTVMLAASVLTIAATGVHVSGVDPFPGLDIIPFAMILSAIALGWGVLNLQLIELEPVGREVLFESLRDGVLLVDDAGRLVDYNPRAAEVIGVTEEMLGQPLADSLPAALARIPSAGPDGEVIVVETGAPPRYLNVMATPMNRPKGRAAGKVIVLRDVTREREAEERLRQSEERYRLLAENTVDVIWTMDLSGRFTYVSPAVERLRGFTPEEVIGQSLEEALCPESLPVVLDGIRRSLRAEEEKLAADPEYLVLEQPCKGGGTVWTEATGRLVCDKEGRPVGFVGMSRDIGGRKQMQDQLHQTLDELTRFNQTMLGREIRMIELKQEINDLAARAGEPARYLIPPG